MRTLPVIALPIIAFVGMLIGCDRASSDQRAQKPAGDPQTSSARIEATKAPTTEPDRAPAVLVIDQNPVSFPPALLRTRVHDGQLIAVLMSDDPKDAIDDKFVSQAAAYLGDAGARRALELLRGIDRVRDIRELTKALVC